MLMAEHAIFDASGHVYIQKHLLIHNDLINHKYSIYNCKIIPFNSNLCLFDTQSDKLVLPASFYNLVYTQNINDFFFPLSQFQKAFIYLIKCD